MTSISSRALGLIVIGTVLYWSSVALAMHVLEPEFSPIRNPMSAYVVGVYGSWMSTTYVVLCAALLSVGYGLATTLARTRLTRTAFSLLLTAAAGALLAGFFPMDFPGPPQTTSGRLHALGGALCFPAWVLGVFLFSLSVHRDRSWRKVSRALLAISMGSIGVLLLAVLSLLVLGFAGYAQRLLVAMLFGWMILVGNQLIRLPREQPLDGAAA